MTTGQELRMPSMSNMAKSVALLLLLSSSLCCVPDSDCAETATCPPPLIDLGDTSLLDASFETGGKAPDETGSEAAVGDVSMVGLAVVDGSFAESAAETALNASEGAPPSIDAGAEQSVTPDAQADGRSPSCTSGETRKCRDNPLSPALGNCAEGAEKCSEGVWGSCSIVPVANDGCNVGDDANCNGTKNEGCSCVNGAKRVCGMAVGSCKTGMQACANSEWGACDAAAPGKLDCTQTIDNNCNGVPDNTEAPCKACALGTTSGCTAQAKGLCAMGTRTCTAFTNKQGVGWSACVPSPSAPKDGCNPPDDANCDGTIGGGCCTTRTCGATCCPNPPPNTTPGCSAAQCASTCTVPLTCSTSGGLFCGSWNFESNSFEGWSRADEAAALGAVISPDHRVAPSKYALAAPFDTSIRTLGPDVLFRISLCGGSVVNLQGKTVSARVFIETPAQADDTLGYRDMSAQAFGYDGFNNTSYRVLNHDMYNTWISVLFTWPALRPPPTDAFTLELAFSLSPDVGTAKGTVYIDDIVIDPPL